MKISCECVSCVISSAMELMARQLPCEKHPQIAAQILEHAARQDWHESPPEFARKLYMLLRDSGGERDSFHAAKKVSTQLALQLLPEMRSIISAAPDKFTAVVKAVIGGNIIDCGADRSIDIKSAVPKLKQVFDMPLDEKLVKEFEKRFYAAKSIFYMLDNCGEAVFDRLLLELFPGKITLGVRGDFILNDITRHELADSGLADYTVYDTGDTTPGVSLKRASKEFMQAMRSADLVIAKGQGNYETLDVYDRPIVHLLRVKCPVVCRALQQEKNSLALVINNC